MKLVIDNYVSPVHPGREKIDLPDEITRPNPYQPPTPGDRRRRRRGPRYVPGRQLPPDRGRRLRRERKRERGLRPRPRNTPGFGRRLERGHGRGIPMPNPIRIFGRLLGPAQLAYDLGLIGGGQKCQWPDSMGPAGEYQLHSGPCPENGHTFQQYFTNAADPPATCPDGQAQFPTGSNLLSASLTSLCEMPDNLTFNYKNLVFWRKYQLPSGNSRSEVIVHYKKTAGSGFRTVPSPVTTPNKVIETGPTPGTATISPSTYRSRFAALAPSYPIEPKPSTTTKTKAPGRGSPRARPRPRRRQRREKKGKSTLQFVLRMLDWISESAEIVDCIYKGLPKDTRRRWERGRGDADDTRRFLDQAGQYGLEGADWKSNAIYHNWHNVDWEKVFECIGNNVVEDAIIGFIARNAPPGTIRAVTGFRGNDIKREVFTLPPDPFSK